MNTKPASVTAKWAARLAPDAVASLDALRLHAGIECCGHGGALWLRGAGAMPRTVPWSCRYEIHDGGALHEPGHILSCGTLPAGEWRPLADAFLLSPPVPVRAGFPPGKIALTLLPCAEPHAPAMIGISADEWRAFADTAPSLRLAGLRFARTDSGRVFVVGKPLPSLRCDLFTLHDGIAVPAGLAWSPRVSAATVRRALHAADGETILLFREGPCLRIPARAWVPASRAAARADVA